MLCSFYIAGFPVELVFSRPVDIGRLLPSFCPFHRDLPAEPPLFRLTIRDSFPELPEEVAVLDESVNDMGKVRLLQDAGGYRVELRSEKGRTHRMRMNLRMDAFQAVLCWDDAQVGQALSSLLRIACSQAILRCDAVSIHASSVYRDGKAYLFLGKSGTGKSTHAALWLKHISGSGLLNDDNPILRIQDGRVVAYGTPWSGKTPCYRNLSFPVGGIVRLRQAPENRFIRCEGIEAFVQLLPGCSVIRQDWRLYETLCDTLVKVTEMVPVARLDCLPDEAAARLCLKEITGFSETLSSEIMI